MTAVGWTLAGMAIWLASLSAPSVPEAIAAALAGLVAATGAALGRRALAGRTQPAGETAGPEPEAAREPGRRVPGQPEAAAGRHTLPWHQRAGPAGPTGGPADAVLAGPTVAGVLFGCLPSLLAVGFAAAALWLPSTGPPVRPSVRLAARIAAPVTGAARRVHTGHVGDYVAWLVCGVAVLGALLGLSIA